MSENPCHFPPQTCSYILSFQFSSWYPRFAKHSIRSTIIRPVPPGFQEYLTSDGIFVPEGSEDRLPEIQFADTDSDAGETKITYSDANSEFRVKRWAFPDLDNRIRDCIEEYEGIFPKLNFSSPKDAYWVLFNASPLRCTSPSDVYILLKSSDFATHDTDPTNVFSGCEDPEPGEERPTYELELVLRKWYPIERNRELRCFVRNNRLIGISQRDMNHYEFLTEDQTKKNVVDAVMKFWEAEIKDEWHGEDYTFDFLLTRSLSGGHIIDFNPYSPRTDPLLFTYKELHKLSEDPPLKPEFRIIPSPHHPAAASNIPIFQHNMVPLEALALGAGRTVDEFTDILKEQIKESMEDDETHLPNGGETNGTAGPQATVLTQ